MPGLEGMNQYPGHLEAQISLHLIFPCGGTLRTLCILRRNIQHLQEIITSAIENVTRDIVAGDRISFRRLQSYKRCTY